MPVSLWKSYANLFEINNVTMTMTKCCCLRHRFNKFNDFFLINDQWHRLILWETLFLLPNAVRYPEDGT